MSKVISPYPIQTLSRDWKPPKGSRWWRFKLVAQEDGIQYTMRVEAPRGESLDDKFSNAVMVSWEFYDGFNTIIDVGFDRITRARIGSVEEPQLLDRMFRNVQIRPQYFLDILHVGPPTPSPGWIPLTEVDDYWHPHDTTAKAVMSHYPREAI